MPWNLTNEKLVSGNGLVQSDNKPLPERKTKQKKQPNSIKARYPGFRCDF